MLVGDRTADPDSVREALVRDAEGRMITDGQLVGDKEVDGEAISGDPKAGEGTKQELELQVQRPMPRFTEADEKNDVKSLSRKLDRSLYLLLKNKDGRWRFPEGGLYARETLHDVRRDNSLRVLTRADM